MRISDWSSDVCSSDLGLRLPISNTKIVPIGEPERGDVVVFKPPQHPEQDWIKRVIGLPGDTIEYKDNQVFVNGQPLAYERVGDYVGVGSGAEMTGASLRSEEHTSELQSLMRSSYAVFCLKKTKDTTHSRE